MDYDSADVKAAGGVVWRRGPGGIEVAVVHRPHHSDWSLPKGKLDPGESWEAAAVREVEEETGLRCELGRLVGETTYRDNKDRLKLVRFWAMRAGDGDLDAARPPTPHHAARRLDLRRFVIHVGGILAGGRR